MKLKILTFKGTYDPKVYLEWEMKVEQVFACYNYNEEKKIIGLPGVRGISLSVVESSEE